MFKVNRCDVIHVIIVNFKMSKLMESYKETQESTSKPFMGTVHCHCGSICPRRVSQTEKSKGV